MASPAGTSSSTFRGDDGSGVEFDATVPYTAGGYVYWARWTANAPVTVLFHENNDSGRLSPVTVLNGQSFVDASKSVPATPAYAGYAFAGWFDVNGVEFDPSTAVTWPHTVWARWTPNASVAVTFDGNGASTSTTTVLSGQSLTDAGSTLPTPSRAGYTFDGWTSNADGTGTVFAATTTITTATTVYAQWTRNPVDTRTSTNDAGNAPASSGSTSTSSAAADRAVEDADNETAKDGTTTDSATAVTEDTQVVWRQTGDEWVAIQRVGKPGSYRYVERTALPTIPAHAVLTVVVSPDANKPSRNTAQALAQAGKLARELGGEVGPVAKANAWRGSARIVASW